MSHSGCSETMRQSVRAGFFPARRANEGSCVPSAGSSTQNAWLRYVAQSHGSAQTSPFRAGLRFRFQFAKYKTACRTSLALPFRLFCSYYKRAAFPMQRLRLTSTTTGKKKQGYPAAALCAYWGKYGILWSRLPPPGKAFGAYQLHSAFVCFFNALSETGGSIHMLIRPITKEERLQSA